jgi:leucyl aminopeptidase
MGSLRANMGSTTAMTKICTEMAGSLGEQVEVEVVAGEELVHRGLNLIHAVGRANVEPPALVDLVYRGNPASKQVVSLVGKGITFDTGGLNIK